MKGKEERSHGEIASYLKVLIMEMLIGEFLVDFLRWPDKIGHLFLSLIDS